MKIYENLETIIYNPASRGTMFRGMLGIRGLESFFFPPTCLNLINNQPVSLSPAYLAPAVQKVGNAIHRIYHYPE